MKQELTERQSQIVRFIRDFQLRYKTSPTVRDICKAFGYRSTNSAAQMLDSLEKKGIITRDGTARSIMISEKDPLAISKFVSPYEKISFVPVGGHADSKNHKAMLENPRGGLFVDKKLLDGAQEAFFAIVGDDGMSKSGIMMGDLVLIDPRTTIEMLIAAARPRTVAAIYQDTLVVRTCKFINDRLFLLPGNPNYSEIVLRPNERNCPVLGHVDMIMRKYLSA